MLDKQLNDLETKIAEIEKRMEEDGDFINEDEFSSLYEKLTDLYTEIEDFVSNGFPYGKVSEKSEELFELQQKRFDKLEVRYNRIKDEDEEGFDTDDEEED